MSDSLKLETGWSESYEPLMSVLGIKSGSLGKQQIFLTAEPSLQLPLESNLLELGI